MSEKPYRLVERDVDRLEEKIRRHRMRIWGIIILVGILFITAFSILYYYYVTKSYTGYEVQSSIARQDSLGTRYAEFQGNILKYSNDGIFYINRKNQFIWNQTYEMQSPMLDICEEYVAIADKNGKKIYIMDTGGTCGEVQTNRPIQQIHVANQGMVAVLMEENGVGYIQLYDKTGVFLAEGELHAQNSGYPLDIAISNDGKKMVVAMLDINEGDIKTTITFYNFGSVGQNEIDNIVSTYSYKNTVIPKVEFLTNDKAVAVGDSRILFFEGNQKPVIKKEIEVNREIRSLFYNDNYIGLVYDNEEQIQTYDMEIFNNVGEEVRTIIFSMEYEVIEFLGNDDICIRNTRECVIYTLKGIKRFQYTFENDLYKVIHISGRQYIFLLSQTTEKVVLK